MQRLSANIVAFSAAPEDASTIIVPSGRRRRDRRGRGAARRNAEGAARHAGAAPASRRPRARRLQDQPRSPQHPRLRAALLRPHRRRRRSAGEALRAEGDRRHRPRHRIYALRARLRPGEGGAAAPPAPVAVAAGRRRRRRAGASRPRARRNGRTASPPDVEVDGDPGAALPRADEPLPQRARSGRRRRRSRR